MLSDCGVEFTVSDEEAVPQNAIGFQLVAGAEVTLVVSKTSERYWLQSDCFEALAVFEAELVKRLTQYYYDKVSTNKHSILCCCSHDPLLMTYHSHRRVHHSRHHLLIHYL